MAGLSTQLKYLLKTPGRAAGAIKVARWVRRWARQWDHVVIHRQSVAQLPKRAAVAMICGPVKGKLHCPPQLTIVLIHDYRRPPLMEMSLRYVGINNYQVIKPAAGGPWRGSKKILAMLDYLRGGGDSSEYILYCDSTDALLRDDPAKAITCLHGQQCDLLFSNTRFSCGYECMPQVKAWADQQAREQGHGGLYINSGVYIGRTAFVRQVFEAAEPFVTDHDLTRQDYQRCYREGTLAARLAEFPKGIGSDQVIMRYLHPQFYPRMKIDYAGRLALR